MEELLKGKHKESAVPRLSIGDRTEISSTPSGSLVAIYLIDDL